MMREIKNLTTLPLSYISALEYFWNLAQCEVCVLTDHLQYTKRSAVSISPPLLREEDRLRLPVRHDGRPRAISDKKIDLSSYPFDRQFKTLRHLYHDFPYGYYYLPQIEALMAEPQENLGDYLLSWHRLIIQWLHLPVKLYPASTLNPGKDATGYIIDLCVRFNLPTYINELIVFEKGWVDAEALRAQGIEVKTFQPFPQANIFAGHRTLSILTFLMKFGPEAGFLIKQFRVD